MKVNSFFIALCYLMILLWILIPKLIFFELIVILFILAMTLDNYNPEFYKKVNQTQKRKLNNKGGK